MRRLLKGLLLAMGVGCAAIGVLHVVAGIAAIPGLADAGANADSQERFFGAIFLAYGLVWIWTARQRPIPARIVRLLAATFLLGGLARVVSIAFHGLPNWFMLTLLAIELALPPVYLLLANADERALRAEAAGPVKPIEPA